MVVDTAGAGLSMRPGLGMRPGLAGIRRTWRPLVLIGSKLIPPAVTDDTGTPLPNPAMPSAAVAPDGSVYVAFEDSTSASSGAIGLVSSRDGGCTWTSTPLPGVSGFAFEPSVAVDAHGTVGVTWYDLRNDRAAQPARGFAAIFTPGRATGQERTGRHLLRPDRARPTGTLMTQSATAR